MMWRREPKEAGYYWYLPLRHCLKQKKIKEAATTMWNYVGDGRVFGIGARESIQISDFPPGRWWGPLEKPK